MQSHVVNGSIEPDAREGVIPSRVSGLDVYHLLSGCDGLCPSVHSRSESNKNGVPAIADRHLVMRTSGPCELWLVSQMRVEVADHHAQTDSEVTFSLGWTDLVNRARVVESSEVMCPPLATDNYHVEVTSCGGREPSQD